ncbi:MAG: hypothetical protein V3T90_12535 [Anaerolineae bacterium]
MDLKSRVFRLIAVIGITLSLLIGPLAQSDQVLAAQAAAPSSNQALILLAPGADVNSVIEAVHLAGGHVTHVFPPAALIGEVPAGASALTGTLAVHRQAIDETALAQLTGKAHCAAQVWNALLAPEVPPDTVQGLDTLEAELVDDALIPPPPEGLQSLSSDSTPGYAETSEFFIGRVAVGIVLPESDGSVDPSTEDWTEDERTLVLSEITAALNWWATREPNAHLTFIYDDGTAAPITTGYEPISRPYNDQALWIAEVMAKKGHAGPSYFDQVRQYNASLREIYDTDWAFTIFVVDSSNDRDNRFSNNYFAYAYLGGPFTVMTYGNNGYGPHNMDAVAAHEIGHIFRALDQYYSAHQPCTRQAGYLDVENQNSQYGDCASDEPSIMRGQTWPYRDGAIDEYARGQIGWRDSDGDGILDPVDTTLSMSSTEHVADAERSNILTFTGSVQDAPYPSPSRRSIIINTIDQVQYRVAGGEWTDTQPLDGTFDSYAEDFTFTTPPLPTGDLAIDLRVLDSFGNELTETLATVSVVDPVDAILDTTMTQLAQQATGEEPTQITYSGQGTSATSHIAGFYYRIDTNPWQPIAADDGALDEAEEDFTLTIDLTVLSPGVHEVQAYSVDGEGNIETSPASDSILVEPRTQHVFLPLVVVVPCQP